MKVVILKYNAGNVRSVSFALERLGVTPLITDQEAEICAADKVIFPGVGEAGSAMRYLKAGNLDRVIASLKQPVLGICLGMQLMCSRSAESQTTCIGVFDQEVERFAVDAVTGLKIPQTGWNTLTRLKGNLFAGVQEETHMYFVHGYYVGLGPQTIAETQYGLTYSAALQKNNFYGVQFHPEKSSTAGERIIQNFLDLK
jgi:glutamine amidotransferase